MKTTAGTCWVVRWTRALASSEPLILGPARSGEVEETCQAKKFPWTVSTLAFTLVPSPGMTELGLVGYDRMSPGREGHLGQLLDRLATVLADVRLHVVPYDDVAHIAESCEALLEAFLTNFSVLRERQPHEEAPGKACAAKTSADKSRLLALAGGDQLETPEITRELATRGPVIDRRGHLAAARPAPSLGREPVQCLVLLLRRPADPVRYPIFIIGTLLVPDRRGDLPAAVF